MHVSLEHLVAAIRYEQVRATPETLGYLALAVCGRVAAGAMLTASAIHLEASGAVTCHSVAEGRCVTEVLRSSLRSMLPHCASENPSLLALCERTLDERAFARSLEAALVPLNRGAAQRALIRLWRSVAALDLEALELDGVDAMGIPAEASSPTPSILIVEQVEESERPLAVAAVGQGNSERSYAPSVLPLSMRPQVLDLTPVLGSPVAPVSRTEAEWELTAPCPPVFEPTPPSPDIKQFVPQRSDVEELLRRFALSH